MEYMVHLKGRSPKHPLAYTSGSAYFSEGGVFARRAKVMKASRKKKGWD